MQGKLASSKFDFGYTEQFCIPGVTSVFFSSCDSVVWALWSSIKQIEAPYVFDLENRIPLLAMQGNWASSHVEEEVSWVFSSCGRNLGCITEFQLGWPFETRVCSAKSGLLSCYDGHLRNLN